MRRIACCSRDREMSFDFDEQDRVTTYNGLESCIHNSCSYDNESGTSRGDGCATDSFDEDNSSCSSSKEVSSSFSFRWLVNKGDERGSDAWEVSKSLRHNSYAKEKPAYTIQYSDVETMKERFAKLLLGDDVTGGRKGIPAALALSNAITNLAASVFGELWKLEPLSVERKSKWRREMDWLLSPTNYMVELVPAKQNGTSGLEIMTPRIRSDIHMNLPALQKLDSMLIEMMDSMVNTEFWYAEGGSRAEGRSSNLRQSQRWWLPSPQVPNTGLSVPERKKLIHQGKVVHQIFKAAKAINGYVLLEMPVPTIVGDALPKSGKESLGVELYRALVAQFKTAEEMMSSLDLKSEHSALETMNRVEIAIFAWKQKMSEQLSGKSPVRKSWSFTRDSISEIDKMELLLERAESLLQMLKMRFPNLPHTFLDATKIQYNKNVGHSILEAYSRVLGSLAFSILSRIGDILQEDSFSNPNSPAVTCSFSGGVNEGVVHIRRSLMDEMNRVEDEGFCYSSESKTSGGDFSDSDAKTSSVTASPCSSRVWCIGREACRSVSPTYSP